MSSVRTRPTYLPSHCLLALALGAILSSTTAAAAESEAEAAKGEAKTLDAVTVTSTKRATSLQKTPVAISAVTAEAVAETGSLDVRDYAKLVPGLSVVNAGPGAARLAMRGIYSTGEATTAVYYDETPISGSVGSTNDAGGRSPEMNLFDVAQVEALRGPQGTLYGAGSMGGAIRVIYEKPKLDTTEGSVEAGYSVTRSGDPSWLTNIMVNTPLIDNVLGARVVLYKRETGGYVDSLAYGRSDVNRSGNEGGRAMFRWQPSEDVTLDLSYTSQNGDGTAVGDTPGNGVKYASSQLTLPEFKDQTRISNATLNWDLGWATLTGVSSYFGRKATYSMDDSYLMQYYAKAYGAYAAASATYAALAAQAESYVPSAIYYPGTTRNWSNEWRLSSKQGGRLDWTAGIYSENRRNSLYSEDVTTDASTGEIIHPLEVFYRRHIFDQLKQQAVYGEATWHAAPAWDLTLGLRYYNYDKTVQGYTDIPLALIGASAKPLTTTQASENGFLKKLNLAYQASDNAMLYLTVADGMRPGGANQVIGLAEGLTAYKGDSLWNYELGAKTQWFDGMLTANVAAYQIDWKDMQISALTSNGAYSFLTNAGKARMRGTEWELAYRPLAGLEFTANFNYIDAVLVADQVNNEIQATSTLGRKGDRVSNIPHFTGMLAGSYRWSLSGDYDGMLRLDTNYVGKSYSTLRPNDPARVSMGDYALTNVRIGVERADARWSAYLYVNNLFDRYAITTAAYNSYYYPYGLAYTTAPRTIGVDLKYNF